MDELYDQLKSLVEAMDQIKQNRRRSKSKAEELCIKLVNSYVTWASIKEIALTLLISLLLEEYESEGEETILDELHSYTEQLFEDKE